jgi:hypothetical protein
MKKIKWLKNITLDCIDKNEPTEISYKANQIIDIADVVIISKSFVNLILPNDLVLLDVRLDSFNYC